jgi:hypothetical protein
MGGRTIFVLNLALKASAKGVFLTDKNSVPLMRNLL